MAIFKDVLGWMKRLGKKKEKEVEVFHIEAPKPKRSGRVRVFRFAKGITQGGKRKHPLHASHFGTFSPLKPISLKRSK